MSNQKKEKKKETKHVEVKEDNKFKQLLSSIISFIKKYKTIAIIVAVVILIVIIILVFFKKEDERFALNEIYDVYPEEVRTLYTNIVDSSCQGDLHLDIKLDAEETKINSLKTENLLDYLFSNIDKNEGLTDSIDKELISKKEKELFTSSPDLISKINNYQHGNYIYSVSGDKITRKKKACETDIKYVSFLYGYSWNKNELSMDVNISYQKDNMLYDLAGKELGAYNGDVTKLFELTKATTYYRFNYIKDGSNFKLDSVIWMSRS